MSPSPIPSPTLSPHAMSGEGRGHFVDGNTSGTVSRQVSMERKRTGSLSGGDDIQDRKHSVTVINAAAKLALSGEIIDNDRAEYSIQGELRAVTNIYI